MASESRGPVRALIFIGMAVVLGALALVGLYQLITQYQEKIDEAKRPEDTVMVIVAARDLYQGVTITEEDLYAIQIPPRFLPEGIFISPEHVVGRIPRERILANEFVRLIVNQRAFQASTRTISTTNDLLGSLVQLGQ